MEDFAIDVCISHLDSAGVRQKHYFTSSVALLRTLREWQQIGRQDILLTWGRTRPIAVEEVNLQLLLAEIECTGMRPGAARSPLRPREAMLLALGHAVSILGCFAAVLSAAASLLFASALGAPGALGGLFGSAVAFVYSAAMAVLFSQVKRLSEG